MNKKNTKYWIMGAIAVIIAIGLTFPFLIAKSRFAAEIALLKKEGLPVTPQEFADKYYKSVPKEENAAETFDIAFSLFEEDKIYKRLIIAGTANAPRYDQKIAPALLIPAQEFIKDNSDLLNKMRELCKYDRIHFNYEWEKGFAILLPRMTKIRCVTRIYSIKTELLIHQNNSRKAYEVLKEMFHFNKLTSQSPFLIGQLVFHACEAMTLGRLERCMNTLTFSPEQLKEFEKFCTEHEQYVVRQWPYIWQTELTFLLIISSFEDLKSSGFSPYKSYPYIKNIPRNYRSAFYYYSGSYMNDLIRQIKSSKATMNVPVDIYVKRIRKLEKIIDDYKASQDYWFTSSNITLYLITIKRIARLRCAKTACAVERFRLKHGKLPKKLGQLVPDFLAKVPLDPFDGKNLRYFRGKFDMKYEIPSVPKKKGINIKYKSVTLKKTGFYVYSIGKDLKDDKGLSLKKRRRKDVLFIVIDKK